MYVISVKRNRSWDGKLYKPSEQEWEYAGYYGTPQSGHPDFGSLCHAEVFPTREAAVSWWRAVRKEINLRSFDCQTLAVRKIVFETAAKL